MNSVFEAGMKAFRAHNAQTRSTGQRNSSALLKAETVALWHAVENYGLMIKQMKGIDGITPEQIEVERLRLEQAKRCLKKVNALRQKGL